MRRKKRDVLESVIEARCNRVAKDRGWSSRKMNGLGFRAWPDRLFLPPPAKRGGLEARRFWMEFKRRGEEPTPEQARIHADLRRRGEPVYWTDNVDYFTAVLAYHEGRTIYQPNRSAFR